MKKKQVAKPKVYIIMEYEQNKDARVHSLYTNKEKADERAFHLTKQYSLAYTSGQYTVAVIKKTLYGKLI